MSVKPVQVFNDTNETLWTCSWSSNGNILGVSGVDRVIRLYGANEDCETLRLKNELKGAHSKTIRSLSFCPRRARIAAASFDGTVSIWSGKSSANSTKEWFCTATLEGHENEVKSCGWGVFLNEQAEEEQVFLATCGRDKTVWIWAMTESIDEVSEEDDFECLAVLQDHEQDVKCLVWHPSEPLFLTGSYDESILAWGPLNPSLDDWVSVGKLTRELNGTVWSLSFSPDGKALAAALSNGSILIYSIPQTGEWQNFSEWPHRIIQISAPFPLANEQNKRNKIDSGCCDGGSEIIDGEGCCKSNASVEHEECESEHEMDQETDSGCCSGGNDRKSAKTESCCGSSKKNNRHDPFIPATELYSVSWNCDSSLLAVACSDHSIRVIEAASGSIMRCIEDAHDGEVNCLAWSPQKKDLLASVGDDGALKLWSIK